MQTDSWTELARWMPTLGLSVTDMASVGYQHDECRHFLPNVGPLSVAGSRRPLFY